MTVLNQVPVEGVRTILRDTSLNDRLLSDGYVVVSMLSSEEVEEFLQQYEKLRPADGFAPDGSGRIRSTYHCTFLDEDSGYKRAANDLIRSFFQPRIDQHVVDYRVLTSNLYVKPPGRGRFEMHQNWPTVADLTEITLTAWCPLVEVTGHNGGIQIVPRSHKIVPDVASPTVPPFFAEIEDLLVEEFLRPVPMSAGDCLIFDDSLIHWSDENRSQEPRVAVQIETVPGESEPVLWYCDAERSPLEWELLAVDDEWFIENSVFDAIARPQGLRMVGRAPNVNRVLSPGEFRQALQRGPRVNEDRYGHVPHRASGKPGWLKRLIDRPRRQR